MTPPRELHVRDLREGRAALIGTKLVLRAPIPPRETTHPASSKKGNRPAAGPRDPADHQRARARGGRDAEAFVEVFHDACLAAGVAFVRKLPTPYVVERRNPDGTFVGRYTRRTKGDYEGVLLDGSKRKIAAELKSDADPAGKLYLRELRDHQRAALEAAAARGDVAVLLVVLGAGPRRALHAVPWSVARECRVLTAADLAPWRVRPCAAYLEHFARKRGVR